MNEVHTGALRDVYIVDGARTPFLKMREKPGKFSASDLAVRAGQVLLERQPFSPEDIDEVVIGCMMPSTDEANIGRIIGLRLGCGKKVPGWTVQRNCASGLQALESAAKDIAAGTCDLVLAGGTEAMSHGPLLLNPDMVEWLADLRASKSFISKIKRAAHLRPSYLVPDVALLKGLTDPIVSLSMGQTAENLAYRFSISRTAMDTYALESHKRTAQAQDKNLLAEVTPAFATDGEFFTADDGVRRDSSLEKLAKLKPFFDKKFGNVTAGNSSQVTDGAAILLLASAKAVKQWKLPVLARIVGTEWAGVDPAEMGLGPVHASTFLLRKNNLTLNDIDYWEINEAFAAQVLACLAAWENKSYRKENLGLDHEFGKINPEHLNVDGGAIAIGHPVGASGARLVLHLAKTLRRNNAQKGVASLCIGGGQGGAMLIENVAEVLS